MLDIVLARHIPSAWSSTSYDETCHIKVKIGPGDYEYQNVVGEFKHMNIESIYRIQNPFIWGRFKLRKEQLQKQKTVTEVQMYHPIRLEDSDVVAEYNCDYRRYSVKNDLQHGNKRPKFYKSPETIQALYESNGMKLSCMVVVRVLNEGSSCVGTVVQRDWDTEYVPEYIVNLL